VTVLKKSYRKIFYIPSKDHLIQVQSQINFTDDLILTFDFSVKNLVALSGGVCEYIDKLVPAKEMHQNNFLLQEFIEKWNFDHNQQDLFVHQDVDFGKSFQIEFVSELFSVMRLAEGFSRLVNEKQQQGQLILVNPEKIITDVLEDLKIHFTSQILDTPKINESYYFDVNIYMNHSLNRKSIKHKVLLFFKKAQAILIQFLKSKKDNKKKMIYVQLYYPTYGIFELIRKLPGIQTLLAPGLNYGNWQDILKQRSIPMYRVKKSQLRFARDIMNNYYSSRCAALILGGNLNVTSCAYRTIDKYVEKRIGEAIGIVDNIQRFLKVQSIDLLILVTNYGFFDSILTSVAKNHDIPSYMIINGMLVSKYGNDSKNATLINSYGARMANDYFKGCKNVVCLGDPRMDKYALRSSKTTSINESDTFVIGIGTAGLNNTDLVSYSAFEFDFMYECLSAIQSLQISGKIVEIRLRVRTNGVVNKYQCFVEEYFPDLNIIFCQDDTLLDYFAKLNLYISFYSQTLLEASAMGIPVIYFKFDEEDLYPPFDSKSELVTAESRTKLFKLMKDFNSDVKIYHNFMDPAILERYIGFIDGGNLQRNIEVIEGMLET
jgi:hypothetical protein